jgi:diguanylate cyclase (GGDEF)-like protein
VNHSRLARHPVTLVAVFAAYFLLGMLGLAWDARASVLWPPSGFALAAVLILGRGVWPAILAGAFLAHLWSTGQATPSIGIAAGAVLEAVIGAELVDRFAGGVNAFRRPATIFRFTALAAFFSTTIGATCGALAMRGSASGLPIDEFAYLWTSWWLGHLTGVLVVSPLVLLWWAGAFSWPRWQKISEGIALLGALVVVGLVVFAGRTPSATKTLPLEFLCVPFLLWAAFRFGRRETATVIAILAAFAVWGTMQELGPFFIEESMNLSMVVMQSYVGVTALMSAVLAAALAEQRHAEARLHELAVTDPLTGLFNYRHLLDVLRAEIARSGRTGRPFTLALIDMDGLKQINDRHGHLVGSRSICRIADVLRRACRTTDTAARYGGDEFAVVLPETSAEGGARVLQRVDQLLAADADTPALAVSGGVALFPRDGDTPTLLLRAADAALYAAKARKGSARASEALAAEDASARVARRTGTE